MDEVAYAANRADDFDIMLSTERGRLVRLCGRLTGDPDAAEDLAQETLFQAWRIRHKLQDQAGRHQWLAAIARRVCLRWARRRGRDLPRAHVRDPLVVDDLESISVDPFDVELEIEREELASLLDRALALLPPATRAVLVQRYIDESPHAEIAARLGLTADAVSMRLTRGKLALRRVLSTQLMDEAAPFGLVESVVTAWQPTRIWCAGCGSQRLDATYTPAEGLLQVRCATCGPVIRADGDFLGDVKAYKPAVSRLLSWIHGYYHLRAVDGAVPCRRCERWLPLRRGSPAWLSYWRGGPDDIYAWCDHCQLGPGVETWASLTQSLPEVRRFWRSHPRMRALPGREVEVDGQPAVVTGYEAVAGRARIEVVASRTTCAVLAIHGSASP